MFSCARQNVSKCSLILLFVVIKLTVTRTALVSLLSFLADRFCTANAETGDSFVLHHNLQGLDVSRLLNALLRLRSLDVASQPPLVLFVVRWNMLRWDWLLGHFKVLPLSEPLEHRELMQLRDGLLRKM